MNVPSGFRRLRSRAGALPGVGGGPLVAAGETDSPVRSVHTTQRDAPLGNGHRRDARRVSARIGPVSGAFFRKRQEEAKYPEWREGFLV